MTIRLIFASIIFLLSSLAIAQETYVLEENFTEMPPMVHEVNVPTRSILIEEDEYRVALKAKIADSAGNKLLLEQVQPVSLVSFELDPETGDIIELIIVGYP